MIHKMIFLTSFVFLFFSNGIPHVKISSSKLHGLKYLNKYIKENMILGALINLFVFALNIFVLVFLNKLESMGCKCAEGYMKTYIKIYAIISIVNVFVFPLIALWMFMSQNGSSSLVPIFASILLVWIFLFFIATIIYFVFAYKYINRLKEEKCACSDNNMRDAWEVLLMIRTALFILMFVVGIFSVAYLAQSKMSAMNTLKSIKGLKSMKDMKDMKNTKNNSGNTKNAQNTIKSNMNNVAKKNDSKKN